LAVHLSGCPTSPTNGVRTSSTHQHITTPNEAQESTGIERGFFEFDISHHRGESQYFEFWTGEREQNRNGIVHPGVGVNN
jgi:hypothetical protein